MAEAGDPRRGGDGKGDEDDEVDEDEDEDDEVDEDEGEDDDEVRAPSARPVQKSKTCLS